MRTKQIIEILEKQQRELNEIKRLLRRFPHPPKFEVGDNVKVIKGAFLNSVGWYGGNVIAKITKVEFHNNDIGYVYTLKDLDGNQVSANEDDIVEI